MRVSEQRAIIREYCQANNIEIKKGGIDFKNYPQKEDFNKWMLREDDNVLFVFFEDGSYVTAYSITENEDDFCDERLAQDFN